MTDLVKIFSFDFHIEKRSSASDFKTSNWILCYIGEHKRNETSCLNVEVMKSCVRSDVYLNSFTKVVLNKLFEGMMEKKD